MTEKIYKFVGIKNYPEIKSWINTNTEAKHRNGPYDTKRNSFHTMQAWRHHLTFDQVIAVQELCEETLKFFGYRFFTTKNELRNFDLNPVT